VLQFLRVKRINLLKGPSILKQPELNFLIDLAQTAGSQLAEMQTQDLDIHLKGRADLVTRADKNVEAYLIDRILSRFPEHTITAEESGNHQGDPAHQWFIDPLDGTLNYAHGLRYYCTSIAYAYQGELKAAVIYAPRDAELFSAEQGKGAFLNGKPIHVSSIDTLENALLGTGFRATLIDTPRSNYNNFLRFSRLTQGVRRLGSAALDLAYVACGRLDGFWDVLLSPWDLAAGVLLVQEAGGVATSLYADAPLRFDGKESILAANPAIHELMLAELLEEKQLSGL
jgi:myo-inositol-1(or 4)-monophosphatase